MRQIHKILVECWFQNGVKENIIHYQGSNYIGLVILSFIKKIHPSFTLVWSIHSEYLVSKIKKNFFISMVFKEIDYIIADNIYIEKQLIAEKFNKNKIKIISPFLMPENYSNEYISLFLKYRKSNLKILFFYAYKLSFNTDGKDVYGFDTLIEAFKKINENVILILLIPAMNNEEKKYYDKIIGQLDNKDKKRVILKNYTNIEGWQYIQSSDIFIRPTITDGDALSVREALYMDKYTVVSDCTVRPDGVTLFKTSDHLNLAKKVNDLLNNEKMKNNKKETNNINNFINFYTNI
ncbi:glycosyltransferase [Candidatus Marithrix sp. Canyon 246]|uniref:glycosyltransferase n=1 Tax=Candidatus Marithrix sp. Canyon 246 TaxID=1827136 RepID=UPI00084A02A4|nr:glycosyltransferase [Candidatus Marithrix sp. Canyon 246]